MVGRMGAPWGPVAFRWSQESPGASWGALKRRRAPDPALRPWPEAPGAIWTQSEQFGNDISAEVVAAVYVSKYTLI